MLIVDKLRKTKISPEKIETIMKEIDARITSVQETEGAGETEIAIINAFTSGNLHRIRARTIRDEIISSYFT